MHIKVLALVNPIPRVPHPVMFTACVSFIAQNRRQAVPITSERTSTMNEILNGIKLIKMYAWEGSFAEAVAAIRKREIGEIVVNSGLDVSLV